MTPIRVVQKVVIPLGTKTTSLSDHVVEVARALAKTGIKHQLTPMSTILEGSLDEIFAAIRVMHEAGFAGAKRVSTSITIDDRRDRPTTAAHKVDVVKKKLET